jgi:hypothetical protein
MVRTLQGASIERKKHAHGRLDTLELNLHYARVRHCLLGCDQQSYWQMWIGTTGYEMDLAEWKLAKQLLAATLSKYGDPAPTVSDENEFMVRTA